MSILDEALEAAITAYVKAAGFELGIIGDWVLIISQQAIIDGEGNTGTRIVNVTSKGLPDYRALGLIDSAHTGFRAKVVRSIQ